MTSFAQFAQAHGLLLEAPRGTDRIYRCPTRTHERSDNGVYLLRGDQTSGWVICYDEGEELHWWSDESREARPWTEAEKTEWIRRKRENELAAAARWRQAAANAQAQINGARSGAGQGYMVRQKLQDVHTLIGANGELIVPMRHHETDELMGAQTITWAPDAVSPPGKWEKRFTAGMRSKGAVLRLGPRKDVTNEVIVEGFATGWSVMKAIDSMRLRARVCITFSAGNLKHVATTNPGPGAVVFADHDESGVGQATAEATGLPWAMSPRVGDDANDLYKRMGLIALSALLAPLMREAR